MGGVSSGTDDFGMFIHPRESQQAIQILVLNQNLGFCVSLLRQLENLHDKIQAHGVDHFGTCQVEFQCAPGRLLDLGILLKGMQFVKQIADASAEDVLPNGDVKMAT